MSDLNAKPPLDAAARERAIKTLDRHVFLDAGAGCGKTHVLVSRYLHILDSSPDASPREIIAATFTKKAAAEMKERLRGECRARTGGEDRAKWERIARELETAPIDTIHGLCSRLLHENAVAGQVDPNFAVLEETDARLMLEEAVRRTLLDRLTGDSETAAELVANLGIGPACEALADLIADRGRFEALLLPDGRPREPDEVLECWEAIGTDLKQHLLQAMQRRPAWVEAKRVLASVTGTNPKCKLELLRAEKAELVALAGNEALPLERRLRALPNLRDGTVRKGKPEDWPSEDQMDAVCEALRSFTTKAGANRKLIDEVAQEDDPEILVASARLTSAVGFEFQAALAAYEAAKQAMSALDYEDLQLKVRDLWESHPDVLAMYQKRVRHVMIDEFQDTNGLQKAILWPLSEGGGIRFVVGDAKQSIYRFRSADVTVFNKTRSDIDDSADGTVERLEVNFRSTPGMTAFFNELFGNEQVMGSDPGAPYEAIYEPLHGYREADDPTALEAYVIGPAAGDDEDEESSASSIGDLRMAEAALLAQRIQELVAGGTQVFDKPAGQWRPVRYGDFGMLFRAMGDIGLYERALRMRDVPYYVVSGRGFYSRQEVQDVINCLRVLENTRDEIALIGVLRSPMFALSDETLFWLSRSPGNWWDRLQAARQPTGAGPLSQIEPGELGKAQFAADTLRHLRSRKNRLSLARLVNEIVEQTGLSATMATQFGGEQTVSNIRKLADIAGDFEQSGSHSLRGLIERLADLVVREEREGQAPVEEEESNVVKLLTIHKAKGLEWPVVIVPDLQRGRHRAREGRLLCHPQWGVVAGIRELDQEKTQWPFIGTAIHRRNQAEEVAEARRLLYVACTRARDRLILSSGLKQWEKVPEDTSLAWLAAGLGLHLEGPGEAQLDGDGWQGLADVRPADAVDEPEPPFGAKSAPLIAEIKPRDVLEGALSNRADGSAVSELIRQISPVPLRHSARERFHATALATYLDCPWRYKLRYIDGVPEEMPSPPALDETEQLSALELGDVVHELLRYVGTGGKARLAEALHSDVAFDTRVATRAQQSLADIEERLAWYLESDTYVQLVRPATRLRTEMTVLFEVEGALIEGKIDALVEDDRGGLHVLDYKTGQHDPRSAREHEFQLGLYCAGVQRTATGNLASAAVVYLNRSQPQFVPINVNTTPEQSLAEALAATKGIREGRFDAAPGDHCAGCALKWACRSEGWDNQEEST